MKVHADIEGLAFDAMQAMMLHEAEEHGLPILEHSATGLKVQSDYGAFGITDQPPNGLRLAVEADREEDLFVLRDSLVGHIAHFLPAVAEQISWSDSVEIGTRPPNFQFATVVSVAKLSSEFLRITLDLSDPKNFDDRAIHFRFVLPRSEDTAPEWPTVAANGSTRWPKGDKELHRPVYTVRAQRGRQIDVDVFAHEGGRAFNWASSVEIDASVALIGPGGGGVIDHKLVVLAGDETAYPAISRLMDALPHHAACKVVLLSHSGARDYPLPARTGVDMLWETSETFESAVRNAVAGCVDPFVWVAGEQKMISNLRKSPELASVAKSDRYLASYWSKM